MQQPKILTGTDDFKKLLLNSDVFVDKSLFIQEIIENSGEVILITRPRRWGKSLNMDMLKRFLEIEVDTQGDLLPPKQRINNKLFIGGPVDLGFGETKTLKPLKIVNQSVIKRQGQFPVIAVNFKQIKAGNYQEIEEEVKSQIINLFEKYRYLEKYLEPSKKLLTNYQKEKLTRYFNGRIEAIDLKDGLSFLSELLFKHFNQKVYILIDEYDTPINNFYLKFGNNLKEFEQVLELFRSMLGGALKTNPYLEKGLITGILRIAKANLFSDLNNVREYTLLDQDFTKFYGFTQNEVDELFTKVLTTTPANKIKDWYNGYTFGNEIIYNPWSIMCCLTSKGRLDHYWIDSGGTGLVDKILLSDEIQEDLHSLLEGNGIIKKLYQQVSFEDIKADLDIFFSLLVFAGYLNPILINDDEECPRYKLTIPNKEVKNIYIERVVNWVTNKLNIRVSDYDNFIRLLSNAQIDKFQQKFSEYLITSTSYHDLSRERDYHNLIGGLLAPLSSEYIIESNKESGHGRFDHLLISRENRKNNAIIIEYKISKTIEDLPIDATKGLQQITDKQYDSRIKEYQYINTIIKIAIAFCGKKIDIQYLISD